MRGGAFFNGKEGRVDFRKNLRLKKDRQLFERTLIINKKTNIIYNVSTHTYVHTLYIILASSQYTLYQTTFDLSFPTLRISGVSEISCDAAQPSRGMPPHYQKDNARNYHP